MKNRWERFPNGRQQTRTSACADCIRSVLTDILEMNGYEAVTAKNGQVAIEMMREMTLDLILTDIVMPHATGVDVLRAAKEMNPLYPVVMVTAYPSRGSVRKMIFLGAADYILKPFNLDVVLVTIDKVLEMQSQFAKLIEIRPSSPAPTHLPAPFPTPRSSRSSDMRSPAASCWAPTSTCSTSWWAVIGRGQPEPTP